MYKQERYAVRVTATLMQKMNVELSEAVDLDWRREMRELVQGSFLLSPVEAVFPPLGEAFHVTERRAIVPIVGKLDTVGK